MYFPVAVVIIAAIALPLLLVRAVRKFQPKPVIRILAVIYVVVMVPAMLWLAFGTAQTNSDEAQLDRELAPILKKEYPGWSAERFSY